ncbi:MAG: hypothetical protein U9Q81_03095 [Pseudomonadota bacterium]|nr:hypothetical protein [Pseudomonadota bacterium]
MATVVARFDRLEEALRDFITNVGIEFNKLYNSQMRTEAEMRAFKDEMRQQSRGMNRKWGEVSKKLGTMVEDLVAPSLSRIIETWLGETVCDLMPRRKRPLADGRAREFDAVAVTSSVVCLNSTRATLRGADPGTLLQWSARVLTATCMAEVFAGAKNE